MQSLTEIYHIGMREYQNGNIDKAVEKFRELLNRDDLERGSEMHLCVLHNLACNIYGNENNRDEAVGYWELASTFNHPGSLYYLGVHFERLGDARGISYYKRAVIEGLGGNNSYVVNAYLTLQNLGIAEMILAPEILSQVYKLLDE